MRQKVEIEVDVPDGWRAVAYRKPELGEWFLGTEGPCQPAGVKLYDYLILEKVEPKRESRWRRVPDVNEKSAAYLYDTPAKAGTRCGCRVERLDYEDGKLVAVTLEPKGEEA